MNRRRQIRFTSQGTTSLKGRRRYRYRRTHCRLAQASPSRWSTRWLERLAPAGAAGGDLDNACARAGLDKIKDQLNQRSRRLPQPGNQLPRPLDRTGDGEDG
jgi:hypothetical protein